MVIQTVSEQPYRVSLYRRYRPQRFAEVVGQDEITRTLKNAVLSNEVAHAYLFSGERGIGKTSIARILSRAVNCLAPIDGEPCNACANCKAVIGNRSLDIMEIDGASNRGIDHIRRLREEVAFAPTDLKTKVYIIDEVHMLTNEAFNALLKTLEEPPAHVVFIFATTEPHKVPRTIISRCQAFDFRKIPQDKIAAQLAEIAKAEEYAIGADALAVISERANGGMRDAIVMLEQAASYATGEITAELLNQMLGLVGNEVRERFLDSLESGDAKSVLETIDSLVDRGKDLEVFLGDLVLVVRNRLAAGTGDAARNIAVCRGLLDVKQDIFRSLDRRIMLEVGLLALMDKIGGVKPERDAIPGKEKAKPITKTTAAAAQKKTKKPEPAVSAEESTVAEPTPTVELDGAAAVAEAQSAVNEEIASLDPFAEKWKALLEQIEQERIAMAAFLSEGTPNLSGNKLTIAFHPDHTFHKESLEKTANLQYLAGIVHRHLGDDCYVEIELNNGVERKQTPSEALREKANLVRQAFDGTIIKEG